MMTTLSIILCLTAVLVDYGITGVASDGYVKLKKGERFTVDCKAKVRGQESFSLYARYPSKHVLVVYDEKTNKHTLGNEYKGRINISGTIDHLKIVINALQLNDSGLYLGHYNKYNIEKNEEEIEEGCAVLLFVKDVDSADADIVSSPENGFAMSEPLVLVLALTAFTMAVVCFLVMWVFAPKVKALCMNRTDDASTRDFNPVYEDMHRLPNK